MLNKMDLKGRIDQSNDLNQIQQIVDEAKALNRAMDQLSQEITGNEGRTKGSNELCQCRYTSQTSI